MLKFKLKYENIEKDFELDGENELLSLKWTLLTNFPKNINKRKLVFIYNEGEIFKQFDEYQALKEIFTNEINIISASLNENDNNEVNKNQIDNNTSQISQKPDILCNSNLILTDLDMIVNSIPYKFFEDFKKNFTDEIDVLKEKLKDSADNTIAKFNESLNLSIKNILQPDFDAMSQNCEILRKNLKNILEGSDKMNNFFETYEESLKIYNKIIDIDNEFIQKNEKVKFSRFCISRSIDYFIKLFENYLKHFDFDNFLPYCSGTEEEFKKDLSLNFQIADFSEIVQSETNTTQNQYPFQKQGKTTPLITMELSEKEKSFCENINIEKIKEKIDKIYSLINDRECLIKKKFNDYKDYLSQVEKEILSDVKIDIHEKLESLVNVIEEIKTIYQSKFSFVEEKEKKNKLRSLIENIEKEQETLDSKIDLLTSENQTVGIVLEKFDVLVFEHLLNKADFYKEFENIQRLLLSYNRNFIEKKEKFCLNRIHGFFLKETKKYSEKEFQLANQTT